MGNINTTNTISNNEKSNDLNKLLNFLLDEHMENFLNKSFCKKTKLFIKQEIFMKQTSLDLKQYSKDKNIFIGKEIENIDDKEKFCESLANFYLKKINLISSIKYIIDYSIQEIENMEKGPVCFKKMKNNISKLIYKSNFNKSSIINYKNKNKIDLPNGITISDKNIREIAYKEYLEIINNKNIKNTLNDLVNTNLMIIEVNQDTCHQLDGQWLSNIKDLIDNNIIPDPNLKNYNKIFQNYISNMKINIDKQINLLLQELEKVVEKKKNKDNNLEFIQKIISNEDLTIIRDKSKNIIKNILVEINKTRFLIVNTQFITVKEIEKKKKLEKDKLELISKIKESEKDFNKTN